LGQQVACDRQVRPLRQGGLEVDPAARVVAGVTAYASVAFLTRWFRHNDLSPFAWYCIAAGAISFILFATKVIA